MSDIQHLIIKLQSKDPYERYEACKELRMSPSLPPEALEALQLVVTNDTNPDVADAAQRAFKLHTTPKSTPTESKTESKKSSIGFFGWFLVGSLISQISDLLFIFPVVTVIVIGILLFMKRNWLVYGIVAAVIANILVFLFIFSVDFGGGLNWDTISLSLIYGISSPFFMVGGFF